MQNGSKTDHPPAVGARRASHMLSDACADSDIGRSIVVRVTRQVLLGQAGDLHRHRSGGGRDRRSLGAGKEGWAQDGHFRQGTAARWCSGVRVPPSLPLACWRKGRVHGRGWPTQSSTPGFVHGVYT